jgi:hypothetical protein
MSTLYIADATALLVLPHCVEPEHVRILWRELTDRVEGKDFGFPKEVVDDLDVLARSEQVLAWASGLGASLDFCTANINHRRWVMHQVQKELGYELGFETVDGKDPSIAAVAMLAREFDVRSAPFVIVTEDVSENPLRPSMREFCERAEWPWCGTRVLLEQFGLGDRLRGQQE